MSISFGKKSPVRLAAMAMVLLFLVSWQPQPANAGPVSKGATWGAVGGAVVGTIVGGRPLAGAAAGAATGAAVGYITKKSR